MAHFRFLSFRAATWTGRCWLSWNWQLACSTRGASSSFSVRARWRSRLRNMTKPAAMARSAPVARAESKALRRSGSPSSWSARFEVGMTGLRIGKWVNLDSSGHHRRIFEGFKGMIRTIKTVFAHFYGYFRGGGGPIGPRSGRGRKKPRFPGSPVRIDRAVRAENERWRKFPHVVCKNSATTRLTFGVDGEKCRPTIQSGRGTGGNSLSSRG